MGEFDQRQPVVGASDASIVKEIAAPLYEAKGWLKFLGVLAIVYGALMVLTIWGIIICWLPIWMGLILLKAGKSVEAAHQSGDKAQLLMSLGKLKTYFTIAGIAAIVAVAVSIIATIFAGGAMLAVLQHGLRSGGMGM
jgi:Family of unknown function (DUF5362)